MFDNYPKTRIKLPKAYQAIYKEHYKNNRDGATTATSASKKMEAWLHKKVALDVQNDFDKSTLEIGAGTLNQLEFELTKQYDIIEPFKELYANSPLLKRVNNIYDDIDEIDLAQRYDRITSVATFEHITDLPKVVAKSCLLLNPEGTLRTSIPNEGTFLWKFAYEMTTGVEFRLKHGLKYSTLMNFEHVNTAREIEEVLNYFYAKNECSCFGLGKGFAFYRFYESSKPNVEKAQKYLLNL